MEQIEQLLVQGCKLYACFEQGRYVVRLQHHTEKTLAVLQESENLLHACQLAAKQLQFLDDTKFKSQQNPV